MEKKKPLVLYDSGRGWGITSANYAAVAEALIRDYMKDYKGGQRELSTSKLRDIYSYIMNVRVRVNSEEEFQENLSDIQYLRVKMAYDAGREGSVKTFLEKTFLMEIAAKIQSFDEFALYCRYAESLVAYFKFCGGKD